MLEVIEKLLILQERDRQMDQTRQELQRIAPERQALLSRADGSKAALDAAKKAVQVLESKRKDLELEVEKKKELIRKYSQQQLQTKKNEEYQALTKEIATNEEAIRAIEDSELDIMEETEAAQAKVAAAKKVADEAQAEADRLVVQLNEREANLKKRLEELEAGRPALAEPVDPSTLKRYERLLQTKGANSVVGIEHSVCGGCHMKLPKSTVITTRNAHEIAACPSCGRLLYHTPDMNLVSDDD